MANKTWNKDYAFQQNTDNQIITSKIWEKAGTVDDYYGFSPGGELWRGIRAKNSFLLCFYVFPFTDSWFQIKYRNPQGYRCFLNLKWKKMEREKLNFMGETFSQF